MNNNRKLSMILVLVLLAALTLQGCKTSTRPVERGIYYWKTTLRLNNWERDFLSHHKVTRLYLRLFDVVKGTGKIHDIVPNATLCYIA